MTRKRGVLPSLVVIVEVLHVCPPFQTVIEVTLDALGFVGQESLA